MRILKFEGATMRDAVAKVKAELGDQAVIISSRQVRRGLLGTAVEISAAIDDDDAPDRRPREPQTPAFAAQPTSPVRPSEQDLDHLIAPIRSELRSLRALVRTAGEPRGPSRIEGELAALRKLVEDLRQSQATPRSHERSIDARGETPLVAASTARVIMLVGPTGAGKTTTIAKLAAQSALVEEKSVHLITLDNYRIGGVDQIRTFAELIGTPLTVVEDSERLSSAIRPSDDLTLIDTAGRSPLDVAANAELVAACAHVAGIEVHLVVPAASSAQVIDALVARYAALRPARLLFTKVDECEVATELSLAPLRLGIPITWVTTGQAVPEDLEQPTQSRIHELASRGLGHQRAA